VKATSLHAGFILNRLGKSARGGFGKGICITLLTMQRNDVSELFVGWNERPSTDQCMKLMKLWNIKSGLP
jgi:hypothetical protein